MSKEILFATYLCCEDDFTRDIRKLLILSKHYARVYYLNPGIYVPNINELGIQNLVYINVPSNGRDFGTWKYALENIQSKTNLLFINNTIQITSEAKFIECLQKLSQYNLSFVTGSRERGNHGQTYLFYVKRSSVNIIRQFFEQYTPTLDRRLTIDSGEVALTEFLTYSGLPPKILHTVFPIRIYLNYLIKGGVRQNLNGLFDYKTINPIYYDSHTISAKYGFLKAKK